MCIICVEFAKDKLTISEAYRNLGEMSAGLGEDHVQEVRVMLDGSAKNAEEERQAAADITLLDDLDIEQWAIKAFGEDNWQEYNSIFPSVWEDADADQLQLDLDAVFDKLSIEDSIDAVNLWTQEWTPTDGED